VDLLGVQIAQLLAESALDLTWVVSLMCLIGLAAGLVCRAAARASVFGSITQLATVQSVQFRTDAPLLHVDRRLDALLRASLPPRAPPDPSTIQSAAFDVKTS
jgi:hypothetical protein